MIPLNCMVLILTVRPSALAMALIMSMSKPVTLPSFSVSNGGTVVSAPTTIVWPELSAASDAGLTTEKAKPAKSVAISAVNDCFFKEILLRRGTFGLVDGDAQFGIIGITLFNSIVKGR